MKKFLGRLLIGLGILAVLFLGFILVEHVRGHRALQARLKELTARGEKLSIAQLLPPPVAPEQNAANDLLALTNVIRGFTTNINDWPLGMVLATPGRATPSWQLNSWAIDDKHSNSWEQFDPKIQTARPLLDQLQVILIKPVIYDDFDYRKNFIDFPILQTLITAKQTVVLLSAAIKDDLHRHDLGAAATHLHSLLVLVKSLEGQKLIITQRVRAACAQFAFVDTWEALQASGWTDDQLSTLQAAWQALEFPKVMAESFEMDRNMSLDFFREVQNLSVSRNKAIAAMEAPRMLEFFGDTMPAHGFVLHYLNIPIWRLAWADQDDLRALNRWQRFIDDFRVARTNSWVASKELLDVADKNVKEIIPGLQIADQQLGLYDRWRFLFSGDTFSITSSVLLKSLRAETEKNMVLTAIALKRYEFRKDNMPNELSALVPEFLNELPRDWMDGQPLRYKPNADGSFLLYSVGENGRDDDGDPRPEVETTKKFSNIWQGRDAVWPIAVPPGNP
ncbi:MAG: hypothetical protein JWR19_2244 [Pedosphaera sp.]|nr:hypothetical protein [Pedosphaera sp.]